MTQRTVFQSALSERHHFPCYWVSVDRSDSHNHLPEEKVKSFCEQKKRSFSLLEICSSPLYLLLLWVPVTEHCKIIENKSFDTFFAYTRWIHNLKEFCSKFLLIYWVSSCWKVCSMSKEHWISLTFINLIEMFIGSFFPYLQYVYV